MEGRDRDKAILDKLGETRFATVTELSALLGVSEVTVRRYLEKLEQDGLLKRTRGGAFVNESMVMEPSFGSKRDQYSDEKRRIAAAAVAMVADGESIALNAGTTTWEMARCLRDRQNLTVVTNSISIAAELCTCPGIRLVVTGGTCRERSQALVGPLVERSLQGVFIDKLFLGVNGISLVHGLTTPNMEEALVNQVLLQAARQVVVVADSSKFGQVTFSQIATVSALQTVITDVGAPEEAVRALRAMQIEVLTV